MTSAQAYALPRRRAVAGRRGELLVLMSLAISFPLIWWVGWTVAGHGYAFNDFHDYWLAAKLVSEGRSPYDIEALRALAAANDLHFVVGTGYSYPLPFAVLMVPFAALSFTAAVLLFNALSLVVFGAAVAAWIAWAHGAAPEARRRRAVLAFAAGTYPPVYGTIANGQANLLLLGLLALGTPFVLRRRTARRSVLGGVSIGLAAVVKLIPGVLFVPLLLARRTGAATGVLIGALGSVAVAVVLAPNAGSGSGGLLSLLEPDAYFTNQSINGFVTRLVRASDRTVAIWPNAFDPRIPTLVLTAGFALATGYVLWRARGWLLQPTGLACGLALALTAGLIGAPKGTYWTQAIALLAVGLLLAAEAPDLRLRRLARLDGCLLGGWFAGAVVQTLLWLQPPARTVALASFVTLLTSASIYGLLALWGLLVWRLAGRPALRPDGQRMAQEWTRGHPVPAADIPGR
jgi:hypothetical protein